MDIYQPYTYLIGWSRLGYWYYGCQYGKKRASRANPKNLWTTYFTSSDYVAMMREWHGEPDVIEVRKTFRTANQTRRCEEKILDRINAVKSPQWLNRGNNGKKFHNIGGHKFPPCSPERKAKISQANLGHPVTDETRKKLRHIALGNKWCIGRKLSSESREKIRQKLLGRIPWNKKII